jgi:deglycase
MARERPVDRPPRINGTDDNPLKTRLRERHRHVVGFHLRPHRGLALVEGEHMSKELKGRRVAALVTKGFEQVELIDPKKALERVGAMVNVVAPEAGTVQGWDHTAWGQEVPVDETLDQAAASNYDGLLLPGGVMNADHIRMNAKAVQLVKDFFDAGKPIAVICHGAWIMVEAGIVKGLKMTSYPSLKTDLRNAGVNWVDQEVVNDHGVVSSRKPQDLPAFNQKMIEEFAEGLHGGGGKRQAAQMRT